MSTQQMIVNTVDPDGNWLYRIGSLSALIFGIGYILIIALYVPAGAPPRGAEARLAYLAGKQTLWWAILGLSVFTDFLLVPVALSLYLVLQGINRNAMLVATACMGLFIILDLTVTWTNYAALITLSGQYATALNEAQRAVLVAAVMVPSTILESNLLFVYNTLTFSVGILMTGLVMLKGNFGRPTAYLGLITGLLGILAVLCLFFVSTSSLIIVIASVLTTLWILAVGYGLYRLSRQ